MGIKNVNEFNLYGEMKSAGDENVYKKGSPYTHLL